VEKQLIEKILNEAKTEEANLVIWDRRDTFTVEADDLGAIEPNDDHLRIPMQDGKLVVYITYDYIYKLVIEKDRSARPGVRAGFAASN
jgi:hypothetical protein